MPAKIDAPPHEKRCEHCGRLYTRPPRCAPKRWIRQRFCSWSCLHGSRKGMPSWRKGRRGPRHPCRICGAPTAYGLSIRRLAGLVACDRPACRAASRELKNARSRATFLARYGGRPLPWRTGGWRAARAVSREEHGLRDWFEARGWIAQHELFWYRLDFALPERKWYIEIDGSSHDDRAIRARDARRDQAIAALGWRGLRVSAKLVREDLHAAEILIRDWIDRQDWPRDSRGAWDLYATAEAKNDPRSAAMTLKS
jgi:hypothetical protein